MLYRKKKKEEEEEEEKKKKEEEEKKKRKRHVHSWSRMNSAQGTDERAINVHDYYLILLFKRRKTRRPRC